MRRAILMAALCVASAAATGCGERPCDDLNLGKEYCLALHLEGALTLDRLKINVGGSSRQTLLREAALPVDVGVLWSQVPTGILTVAAEYQGRTVGLGLGAIPDFGLLHQQSLTLTLQPVDVSVDLGVTYDLTPACTDTERDPLNCGQCGHDCHGGACEAGSCRPALLAQTQGTPVGVAIAPEHLYFSETNGEIHRLPLAGGGPSLVTTVGQARQIAFSGSTLCITTGDLGTVVGWTGSTIVTLSSGQPSLLGIAANANDVYFSGGVGFIRRVVTGSPAMPVTLYSGLSGVGALTLTPDDQLVWVEPGLNQIRKAATAPVDMGGAGDLGASVITTLLLDQMSVGGVAVQGGALFWTRMDEGRVHRRSLSALGGVDGPDEAIAWDQGRPSAIAVDAGFVYWVNESSRTVMRLAR